jgi:hypothetical protein
MTAERLRPKSKRGEDNKEFGDIQYLRILVSRPICHPDWSTGFRSDHRIFAVETTRFSRWRKPHLLSVNYWAV